MIRNPMRRLKCFGHYGFANGYYSKEVKNRTFWDADDVNSLAKIYPAPCQKCPKSRKCFKKSVNEASIPKVRISLTKVDYKPEDIMELMFKAEQNGLKRRLSE